MATLASHPSPGSLRAWLGAIRPRTLGASVVPVAVATAVAFSEDGARAGPALAALATALWLQIGANLVNDFADFERGVDTGQRLGPVRAAQAGLLAPSLLRRAALASFALALATGGYLVSLAGWPIAVLGIAAIASGWFYAGGRLPLGARGLGDPLVFLFFGVAAVAGTQYVQTANLSRLALGCAVPIGLLCVAILGVNNLRDLEGDANAGKRTLAVRLGERGARLYLAALVVGSYLSLPAIWLVGASPMAAVTPLLSLPLAAKLLREFRCARGASLNDVLARTAQLHAVFGSLLALGIAV